MSRKLKNIIMLILLGLLCISIFLTMNYVKNNSSTNSNLGNTMGEMGEMPGGNGSSTSPGKPNGENNESMSESPEKPEGNTSDSTVPEIPNDLNGDNNMAAPGEMPNDMVGDGNLQKLDVKYLVLFGTEGLLISVIITYLIMSGFNKKTFKETFKNSDKLVIGILMIVILTSGVMYLSSKITTNYFLNNQNNAPGNQNDMQNASVSYSGVKEIKEDSTISSGEFTSSKKDENAVLVSGDIDVTLSNIVVNKTGDSNGGDNSSFYGNNSGIIAKDGANLILKNITVTTDAVGANGVFSYGGTATTNNSSGDGTTVTISDSKITTTKDNSGGIMTTGGGVMKANNLTINTTGISSAAIRTDRGGGTVSVDKGTYTTTGTGSPVIYSTANITVSNATLAAKASEGIVIEGKNSVTINACDLTDSNTKLNGQSTTYKNIFLYQSMSGDASDGTAEFTAKDSNITTNNGDSFYVTNVAATINLENNSIVNNDTSGNFLRAQKDSWGNSGSNGGAVTLNMINQKASGNIVIDSISTLNMVMKASSYYEGMINGSNEAKEIKLTLDKSSKIKLTGDSYVTYFDNEDSSNSNIDFNNYKLYVNGKAVN